MGAGNMGSVRYARRLRSPTRRVTDDLLQYNAAASFLYTAKSLCFKGALAWRFDAAAQWPTFVRPDGTFRPAAAVMQAFGGP
jgi:hypothetical protein